ncbi:hypothetical protein NA57DRAFT_71049 [Rhizodiscina lignyota]|uniref:F-box domain-containing protein n=1 Tax=Rhizodiscina lignyota TaxID=1504668 RepID=A0A9P4MGV6_9PEZI|nr:hypothetical protein NA57DRAFT_71049 [Rhizodiscina lignyota]
MADSKKRNKKTKIKEREANESPHMLASLASPCKFLQLPRELRDMIYTCLFTSTRLAFGKRYIRRMGIVEPVTVKPAPNALAILRTCRQINEEAGSVWLGQVLFSFENIDALLDKFWPLPPTTLTKIRHVRTHGDTLFIMLPGDDEEVPYRAASVLKLLPSLNLHTLTVLGSLGGQDGYKTLDGFIKHGTGWKELYFVVRNSALLGFAKKHVNIEGWPWHKPQPITWNEILLQRDGANSGANIVSYRSTRSNSPGSVMDPLTRQIFEQTVSTPKDLETFEVAADDNLLTAQEGMKEVLFIAKRGRSVDTMDRDESLYGWQDLRGWSMTWPEIKHKCIDYLYDLSEDDEVMVDSYSNIHEYVWPDLH